MKTSKFLLFVIILLLPLLTNAQDTGKPLASFNKVIVSPCVNLVLSQGEAESIRILYNGIPEDKVNVKISGNKLRIFLDKSRITEKQTHSWYGGQKLSRGIYNGKSITAYVTYKSLKGLEVRGRENVRCEGTVGAKKFKLKVYGESEVYLSSLQSEKLKASIYGENKVTIQSGETNMQVYRLFGENRIETGGLRSKLTFTRIFGEGEIRLNASKEVRVNAVGEPAITIEGAPYISRGIILGHADIRVSY
jgi:hypothetical protein